MLYCGLCINAFICLIHDVCCALGDLYTITASWAVNRGLWFTDLSCFSPTTLYVQDKVFIARYIQDKV